MNKFFKIAACALSLLFAGISANVNAQNDELLTMDKSIRQMMDFYDADTIMVVLPDNYKISSEDEAEIKSFVFWKRKPAYIFRNESSLKPSDMKRHLHFFGPCYKFKNKELIDVPFTLEANGFSYMDEMYSKPEHAFYYMHSNGKRLYTCRNGENQPLTYIRRMAGAYQLYVFNGNDLLVPALPLEIEQRISSRVWFRAGQLAAK